MAGSDMASVLLPLWIHSYRDTEAAAEIRSRAAELQSYDHSLVKAGVAPLQLAILAGAATRLLLASGASKQLHLTIAGTKGSVVAAMSLPWPAYVVAGWVFSARALAAMRGRMLGACEAVGGDARRLAPSITTTANLIGTGLTLGWGMLLLDSFDLGVALSTAWGALGLGGVALSLGLRDAVGDFVAGLQLLISPNFKVGQTIELGSGVKGMVVGIGATSTTLLTRTGVSMAPHVVPNSAIMSAKGGVKNLSEAWHRYFEKRLSLRAESMAHVDKLCGKVRIGRGFVRPFSLIHSRELDAQSSIYQLREYLAAHPEVIQNTLMAADRAYAAVSSLEHGVVTVTVKCSVRKKDKPLFSVLTGDMLLELGKIVEEAEGVSMVRPVDELLETMHSRRQQ